MYRYIDRYIYIYIARRQSESVYNTSRGARRGTTTATETRRPKRHRATSAPFARVAPRAAAASPSRSSSSHAHPSAALVPPTFASATLATTATMTTARGLTPPPPPSLAPSRVAGAAAGAQPREGCARYGVRPAAAERLQDDGEPPSDGRPRGACDGQSIWAPVSFLVPPRRLAWHRSRTSASTATTSRIGLPVRPGARLEGSHLGLCRARAVVCVSPVAWQRASMMPQVFVSPLLLLGVPLFAVGRLRHVSVPSHASAVRCGRHSKGQQPPRSRAVLEALRAPLVRAAGAVILNCVRGVLASGKYGRSCLFLNKGNKAPAVENFAWLPVGLI